MKEPFTSEYSYKWYAFNLNLECPRCRSGIIFQKPENYPVCSACGQEYKIPWTEVLKNIKIRNIGGKNFGSRQLGRITGTWSADPEKEIKCRHCGSAYALSGGIELDKIRCPSCDKALTFWQYGQFEDIVFYLPDGDALDEEVKMVSVHCASCGAPLEADPRNNEFTCKFCSTLNILPPQLRYRIPVHDIYAGARQEKKVLVRPLRVELIGKKLLRVIGRNGFTVEELNEILLNKKNDLGIYQVIIDELGYVPPDDILAGIYAATVNRQVVKLSGARLGKRTEEIVRRIQEFEPGYRDTSKPAAARDASIPEAEIERTGNSPAGKHNTGRKKIIFEIFQAFFLGAVTGAPLTFFILGIFPHIARIASPVLCDGDMSVKPFLTLHRIAGIFSELFRSGGNISISGSNEFTCNGMPMSFGRIFFPFFLLASVIFTVYYYRTFRKYRITDEQ